MWKVISDPVSRQATAFVLLNEPKPKEVTQDMFVYQDVGKSSKMFNWISWEPENLELGLSYICRIEDLRKKLMVVPDLGEVDLLY